MSTFINRHPPVAPGRFGTPPAISRGRAQGYTHRSRVIEHLQNPSGIRLAVIACAYQEETLVPFFLRHYWFADRIFILLGRSSDKTEELLRADPKVEISYLDMPQGLDDGLKRDKLNETVSRLGNFHWAIVVDVDEFLFPEGDPACSKFKDTLALVEPDANCVMAFMANVFRHKTDKDLDPKAPGPVIYQRMHGNQASITGNAKPCIVRTQPIPSFHVGQHAVVPYHVSKNIKFTGAHWQGADPSFSIHRVYQGRRLRLSPRNKKMHWGNGHDNATPELLKIAYEAHSTDPVCL